jgi:hypothetical protein
MKLERKEYQKRLYNQVDEDLERKEVETAQLDYSDQKARSEAAQELPPAWEPEPSSWTVGYEPVGATSIGVEQERRTHSRRGGLRVKSTKLSDHNEGRHPSDGTQSERLARIDKKRITQAFCTRLDINGLLQQEAVRAMLLLDLQRFGAHKQIERVALAVICVVVDYHRRYKLRNPDAERLGSVPMFKKLAHETGLADHHVQLSRKVKEELKKAGFFEPGAPGLSVWEENRNPPGTLGEKVARPLFLRHQEVEAVETDEPSSRFLSEKFSQILSR